MILFKNIITIKKILFFVVFFIVAFLINQMVKMPLEQLMLNSELIHAVRSSITYIAVLCLPNIIFYLLMGAALSIVMQRSLVFWASLYCIFELSWLLFFLSPLFFEADLFGYALIFMPKIVIPLSVVIGVYIAKLIRKARGLV